MIFLLKEAAETICGDDARILSTIKSQFSSYASQRTLGIPYSDVEKRKKGDVFWNASTTDILKAARPRIAERMAV